ncbi:MAG: hypothetical protein HY832_03195 [Candidatus Aenigmarchaeota archaeon]|nr:hypothetical protein [Candidatus Aenigmarchaeota archaeon]
MRNEKIALLAIMGLYLLSLPLAGFAMQIKPIDLIVDKIVGPSQVLTPEKYDSRAFTFTTKIKLAPLLSEQVAMIPGNAKIKWYVNGVDACKNMDIVVLSKTCEAQKPGEDQTLTFYVKRTVSIHDRQDTHRETWEIGAKIIGYTDANAKNNEKNHWLTVIERQRMPRPIPGERV